MDYNRIENRDSIGIKYFQLNVKLLVEGFESNCVEYNIGNQQDKIRMESDCRVFCLAKILKGKLQSIKPFTYDLIRRQLFSYFGNFSKDSDISLDDILKYERECSQKCKSDCNTQIYLAEIV